MKIQRTKRAKKTLQFFSIAYGAIPPYHVLLDGTFIHRSASVHQEIPALIERALNTDKFKLYTTRQVQRELESLKLQEGLDAIRGLGKRITVLQSGAKTAQDSIARLIRAPDLPGGQSFILATRDPGLVKEARMYPKVMIIQLNGVVATLETPSSAAMSTYRKSQEDAARSRIERSRKALAKPDASADLKPSTDNSSVPARRVLPDFSDLCNATGDDQNDELYDPLEPSREASEDHVGGSADVVVSAPGDKRFGENAAAESVAKPGGSTESRLDRELERMMGRSRHDSSAKPSGGKGEGHRKHEKRERQDRSERSKHHRSGPQAPRFKTTTASAIDG